MRARHLSASRIRQSFSAMLNDAVRDRRLSTNPASGVHLPRLPRTERRFLTHEQVGDLADACGPYRLLVLVLAYTGLRWGEATALRVGHVDLKTGRIGVLDAVSEISGRLVFDSPKNHQVRSVPVPKFICDQLAGHIVGRAPDDLVFRSPQGAVLRGSNFRRRCFDRAADAVGLPGLVPHELRHTASSLAISAGANVKGVQAMLGHASATQTLDRYGHLFADDLAAVAARLDQAVAVLVPPVCPTATPAGSERHQINR